MEIHLDISAAQVYDDFFVPALFAQWADPVAEAAGIQAGERVLDVACGTGALTRAVKERAGPCGVVIGLDANRAMLEVAGRKAPEITWREGTAEALPFDGASFDAVVSQFGLMFFADRPGAVREMARVLRPGGRLAVAVWDSLDRSPGYAALVSLLERLFGAAVANSLRAPFALGDTQALRSLFRDAGVADLRVETRDGRARFPGIRQWVHADAKGWLQLDDEQSDRLYAAAETELRSFAGPGGVVSFSVPAHLVTAIRSGTPTGA
ncbi:MAG TPA: methyltransferase domain-containing protein [Candidatus Polarisedimenticolia bacterium]|nr:methyltransferase domain-containing protein [Candidatus Polarisedimenticolia bacterium]